MVEAMGLIVSIPVNIVRFTDEHFPGWVECTFTDAHSQLHAFIEKAPVVTPENLSPLSAYPKFGAIACEIVAEAEDEGNRKLIHISTERPWGLASTTGSTRFVVLASQIVR